MAKDGFHEMVCNAQVYHVAVAVDVPAGICGCQCVAQRVSRGRAYAGKRLATCRMRWVIEYKA